MPSYYKLYRLSVKSVKKPGKVANASLEPVYQTAVVRILSVSFPVPFVYSMHVLFYTYVGTLFFILVGGS